MRERSLAERTDRAARAAKAKSESLALGQPLAARNAHRATPHVVWVHVREEIVHV